MMAETGPLAADRFRPVANVIARRLGEQAILVDLNGSTIYELNRTGARVWELMAEGLAFGDAVHRLSAEFGADEGTIAADIRELMAALRASGLVEPR